MSSLQFGLVFDLQCSGPGDRVAPADADVEYEPEETVCALEGAIRQLGHQPVRIGSPHDLLAQLGKGELPALDVALNIAEGFGGRNREAWAPVLLEMANVPHLGSDALTLSTTLDKVWAAERVAAHGVPVPRQAWASTASEVENLSLPGDFPLFVKPRWEGTAKGIRPSSLVADRAGLLREVARIAGEYGQPALIEPFLAGAEYTVCVIGNDPPRALPALQRALDAASRIGLHALAPHAPSRRALEPCTPGALDAALEAQLARLALRAYRALGCLDFARADFRLDADGAPCFLEINPLPTFAPDGSFGILAELEGRSHEALLADVLALGLVRLGLA
ncbi:MAG: D-alanine--D-alanine ligase [Myxococcota bacterium]